MYASIASFDKIQQTLYYHRLPSRRPSTCWPSRLSTVPCRRKEWWKELWLSSQNRRNRMRNCGRLNEGYALRNRATDKKDACKNVDTVKSKRESWEENNFPPRVYHLLHETYRTFCCLQIVDGKNPEEDTFERSQNDEDPSRMEPKSATLRYPLFYNL